MTEHLRALRQAPQGITGRIEVPPSKSLTQRALIAAARAGHGAAVVRPLNAEDPRLLHAALVSAGFALDWSEGVVRASGHDPLSHADLDLGNNGTGVRLLLAQLASLPGEFRVDGSTRLRERPLGALVTSLRRLGARVRPEVPGRGDRLPLWVKGRQLSGGTIELDASASSQFISALLMLAPVLPSGLEVRVRSVPPSRPYVDLTIAVMEHFGVKVETLEQGLAWRVPAQRYQVATTTVEGDWSAAAFPLVAVAMAGGEVEIPHLVFPSPQGDARILDILVEAGCRPFVSEQGVRLQGPASRPLDVDLRDTPDLFPVLAVALAQLGGRLTGLAGLVHKESDRLGEMVRLLAEMGARLDRRDDEVSSRGGVALRAPSHPLDPAHDHRLAMALAVAATRTRGLLLADADCVGKSWPTFWDAWSALLGET